MIRIGILQRMYNLGDEAVIDEIAVNRTFEFFCHISPTEVLPHPSALSKFRKMRLDESTMDDIMAEIVRQMIEKGIRSLQDKDARVGRKDHTTSFFGYKDEYIMTEDGIITGVTVQPGNYRDGDHYKDLLEKTKKAGINAYIPISHSAYRINEELFTYNKDSDTWTCINGNESDTGKKRKNSIDYRFERECCRRCPQRQQCMGKTKRIAKNLNVGTSTAELYEHSRFKQSEDFLERYKVRAKIEPKMRRMMSFSTRF